MKIKKLKIAWFRGAADPVELDLNLKSLALYGENGSGKSSFVDAIEHNINNGRINHLAHEYSGRRQEKAIINTHIPGSQNCEILITMEDNSTIETKILPNGTFTVIPPGGELTSWGYRHTILRQNEVADFITDTKGNKYSALLPLLGLSHLEFAAENLRKIERQINISSAIDQNKVEIGKIEVKRKSVFGNATKDDIKDCLENLYKTYCNKTVSSESISEIIEATISSLQVKIGQLTSEQKKYSHFLQVSQLNLQGSLDSIKTSAIELGEFARPLILEKLNVLRASIAYSGKNKEEELECPACGRTISAEKFSTHLIAEEKSLKETVSKFDRHNLNVSNLCDQLQNLKAILNEPLLNEWKSNQDGDTIQFIQTLEIGSIRQSFKDEIRAEIENKLLPLIDATKLQVANPMKDVAELLADKEKLETIKELFKSASLTKRNKKTQELISYISDLQRLYREQIRIQSSTIIGAISGDIAHMWGILHPDEKVEDVRLCFPEDVDKAIEVGLKFYGIDQDSPRLTLSEGHRNSLGLCIFLAMTKKDLGNPIILDDVVVSFDRNHRGMLGRLLDKEFSDRQVILFTHERDWYIELKRQLDQKTWEFKTLMPWESPETGIRFSTKQFAFDDARKLLPTDPDLAGNMARKIMDVSVAILAEALKVELPYLHRERNDHRTFHEFLEKMGSSTFQIKRNGTSYESFTEALDDIKLADRLLISWGNRASHDFNIVKNEASELIDTCERTIGRFTCINCNKEVSRLEDERSDFKQCICGNLKWKY